MRSTQDTSCMHATLWSQSASYQWSLSQPSGCKSVAYLLLAASRRLPQSPTDALHDADL